ncbi:hypothetical protein CRUP_023841, partial [Coryphaenoides rupestris]
CLGGADEDEDAARQAAAGRKNGVKVKHVKRREKKFDKKKESRRHKQKQKHKEKTRHSDRAEGRDNSGLHQCLGPSCVMASRVNSKYCSDDCGMKLAANRIYEILPQRIQQWQQSPCIAEEQGKKQLERIRRDQQNARLRLTEMERRFHELEGIIAKAKQQMVQQDEEVEGRAGGHRPAEFGGAGKPPKQPKGARRHRERWEPGGRGREWGDGEAEGRREKGRQKAGRAHRKRAALGQTGGTGAQGRWRRVTQQEESQTSQPGGAGTGYKPQKAKTPPPTYRRQRDGRGGAGAGQRRRREGPPPPRTTGREREAGEADRGSRRRGSTERGSNRGEEQKAGTGSGPRQTTGRKKARRASKPQAAEREQGGRGDRTEGGKVKKDGKGERRAGGTAGNGRRARQGATAGERWRGGRQHSGTGRQHDGGGASAVRRVTGTGGDTETGQAAANRRVTNGRREAAQ